MSQRMSRMEKSFFQGSQRGMGARTIHRPYWLLLLLRRVAGRVEYTTRFR
jgi:hypothetical protein